MGFRRTEQLLDNIHYISESRYSQASYSACDELMDLDNAIIRADLSERQMDILRMYYEYEFTQQEIADMLGIRQDVVSRHISRAIRRIAKEGDDR